MTVRVIKAGQQSRPMQIDDLCVRTLQVNDIVMRADRDDAALSDGNGFGGCVSPPKCFDTGMSEDKIGHEPIMTQLIQCVPNFSEGRRPEVIHNIIDAVRQSPGVRLADWSADPDHNRMVVTFVGPPGAVRAAAHAACAVAVREINLRQHTGIHPRLGAVDVLPLVPLTDITLDECASHARELGRELADQHYLPVFLYEAASANDLSLPLIRKEAFRSLTPDYGPPLPHPSAGATVVGARGSLIAYNINLATDDVRIARAIARELRGNGRAGLIGVRALGLALTSRQRTQVSMNITKTQETPLLAVFSYVAQRAQELGTLAVGSENHRRATRIYRIRRDRRRFEGPRGFSRARCYGKTGPLATSAMLVLQPARGLFTARHEQ